MSTSYLLNFTVLLEGGRTSSIHRDLAAIDMQKGQLTPLKHDERSAYSEDTQLVMEPMTDPWLEPYSHLGPAGLLQFNVRLRADSPVSVSFHDPQKDGKVRTYSDVTDQSHEFGNPLPGKYTIAWSEPRKDE